MFSVLLEAGGDDAHSEGHRSLVPAAEVWRHVVSTGERAAAARGLGVWGGCMVEPAYLSPLLLLPYTHTHTFVAWVTSVLGTVCVMARTTPFSVCFSLRSSRTRNEPPPGGVDRRLSVFPLPLPAGAKLLAHWHT